MPINTDELKRRLRVTANAGYIASPLAKMLLDELESIDNTSFVEYVIEDWREFLNILSFHISSNAYVTLLASKDETDTNKENNNV